MQKWVKKQASNTVNTLKVLSLEMAIVMLAFLSSLVLVVFLVRKVFVHEAGGLDDYIFQFFNSITSPGTTAVMEAFTSLGGQYFLVPANLSIFAFAYFIRRDKWFAIKTLSVAISSLIIMFGLKLLFARPRPGDPLLNEVAGYSFPSGHAFMSFTFFGLLIYIVYNKMKNPIARFITMAVLLFTTIMIGASRIYLRVHYFTDVLAGICLGVMWLVISIWLLNKIEANKKSLPPVEN